MTTSLIRTFLATAWFAIIGFWPVIGDADERTKGFRPVDQETWKCMVDSSQREKGTIYTSRYPDPGRSTTRVGALDYVLDYRFDPASKSVYYTIVDSHGVLPRTFWDGVKASIKACNK